jgi:hypothetical protein
VLRGTHDPDSEPYPTRRMERMAFDHFEAQAPRSPFTPQVQSGVGPSAKMLVTVLDGFSKWKGSSGYASGDCWDRR